MKSLKKFWVKIIPGFLVRFFSKSYIGGYSISEVVNKCDNLQKRKFLSTLNLLGEHVTTSGKAEENCEIYLQLIEQIKDRAGYISISIKLSQFGIFTDEILAKKLVKKIIASAEKYDIRITIDMEESELVDITLQIYTELLEEFTSIGIVLQSRLLRTKSDIDMLQNQLVKARVRLCIGIYSENADIALTKKSAMKKALILYSKSLLENGHYVECASQDKSTVRAFLKVMEEKKISDSQVEFQQLLGVPLLSVQDELIEMGYSIRLYVPFVLDKGEATSYLKRRMSSNPSLISYVVKNLFSRKKNVL